MLECPVCKTKLVTKRDKNNKPYAICDDCGVQIFVRGRAGVRKVEYMEQGEKAIAELLFKTNKNS